jgi:restriction system protein
MLTTWPTSLELKQATLEVLIKIGGPCEVSQLDREIITMLNLSEELKSKMRSTSRSEIQYRLAWARTKAKQNGLIQRESPRFWSITEKGRESA